MFLGGIDVVVLFNFFVGWKAGEWGRREKLAFHDSSTASDPCCPLACMDGSQISKAVQTLGLLDAFTGGSGRHLTVERDFDVCLPAFHALSRAFDAQGGHGPTDAMDVEKDMEEQRLRRYPTWQSLLEDEVDGACMLIAVHPRPGMRGLWRGGGAKRFTVALTRAPLPSPRILCVRGSAAFCCTTEQRSWPRARVYPFQPGAGASESGDPRTR